MSLTRKYNIDPRECFMTVIDLETTGVDPKANAIINAGLVLISPDSFTKSGKEFLESLEAECINFDYSEALEKGRVWNENTKNWHETLPSSVKELNFESSGRASISDSLAKIYDILNTMNTLADRAGVNHYIVGNSPLFDNEFLKSYYANFSKLREPWAFWQDMDFRTVANLRCVPKQRIEEMKEEVSEFLGYSGKDLSHYALFDSYLEAYMLKEMICSIYEKL